MAGGLYTSTAAHGSRFHTAVTERMDGWYPDPPHCPSCVPSRTYSPDASAMNPSISSSIGTSIGFDSSIAEGTRCLRLAAAATMALVEKGSLRPGGDDEPRRAHTDTHTRAHPEHLRCPCPQSFPATRCSSCGITTPAVWLRRRRYSLLGAADAVSAAARSLKRVMRRLGSSGGSALGTSDPDNRSFGSGTPGLRRASGPVPFFERGEGGRGGGKVRGKRRRGVPAPLPRRVAPFLRFLFFCCTRLHHRPPYPDRPGD